jgi:hypothetical protein
MTAEPVTFVHGVEVPGDPRLHDVAEFVAYDNPRRTVGRTICGLSIEGGWLWRWTPEEDAPPPCTDCATLPPFWPL